MYEKRQTREVGVTALSLAGKTEDEVKAMVKDPTIPTPSVTTPPDTIPILTLADVERATRPTE